MVEIKFSRHGCPITFQSDNGTAFVGELTKELMRGSHVAHAHSTTYHPHQMEEGGYLMMNSAC